MQQYSRRSILLLFALLLVGICSCEQPPSVPSSVTLDGKTMGTSYRIVLVELPADSSPEKLQSEIDELLETINNQMSTWRPDSELSRFNRDAGIDWFEVSAATAEVVAESLRVSEHSEGAFDVTVSPLIDLWGFGANKSSQRIPSDEQITAALSLVGYRKIEARPSPPAIKKNDKRMQINLSAIAKGYAVDKVAEHLDSLNISGYMVEIGGEVRTKGTRADGTLWTIGIESPVPNQRGRLHRAIELQTKAMATSGDYRSYFEKEGRRYSHTIDPRTGRPITHRLASVTVVANHCMSADALATTLMVLGPDAGYSLAMKENLAVLMIVRGEDGFHDKTTPAFEKLGQ